MDNLLTYLPCSFCKEKKEKRKEKGFSTPFLKRKEINKEKKLLQQANNFSIDIPIYWVYD